MSPKKPRTNAEKIKTLKDAFKKFMTETEKLRQNHKKDIMRILKEIDENKLKEVRKKLGI
jgi:hypothetical protein